MGYHSLASQMIATERSKVQNSPLAINDKEAGTTNNILYKAQK